MIHQRIPSDLPKTLGMSMYDVVYIDAQGEETPVARQLDDRKDAAEVARQAAAERGAGRMVLPGSQRSAQLRLRHPRAARRSRVAAGSNPFAAASR